MLEFIAAHRPPRPTRLSLERRIEELELTPSDAVAGGKLTRWGSQQNAVAVCLDAQPNESRLSCGALKKDSFPNLSRAASFKRLLGRSVQLLSTDGGRRTSARQQM